MKTIIRFRNRQVFTQQPDGSWNMSETENEYNINQLLRNGHIVSFSTPLTTVVLSAVHTDELIIRSVHMPNGDPILYHGEQEVNGLIEKMIETGGVLKISWN